MECKKDAFARERGREVQLGAGTGAREKRKCIREKRRCSGRKTLVMTLISAWVDRGRAKRGSRLQREKTDQQHKAKNGRIKNSKPICP